MNEISWALFGVIMIGSFMWLHERAMWRQLVSGRDEQIDNLLDDLDDAAEREEAFADDADWWRNGDEPQN